MTGNYIGELQNRILLHVMWVLIHRYSDQAPPNQVPFNDGSEDEIDEDAYDLRDVSSDVEVNPDDLEVDSGPDAG